MLQGLLFVYINSPEPISKEEKNVTTHSIEIGGTEVEYEATAATMNIKANLFYSQYHLSERQKVVLTLA